MTPKIECRAAVDSAGAVRVYEFRDGSESAALAPSRNPLRQARKDVQSLFFALWQRKKAVNRAHWGNALMTSRRKVACRRMKMKKFRVPQ